MLRRWQVYILYFTPKYVFKTLNVKNWRVRCFYDWPHYILKECLLTLLKVVFHSKFPIFAIFLNIHKVSPNTDHNIICMFLKRKSKTISKPEKSSLSYTNQGKITILPRANNGIQLVNSIVCNFNGIVLFNYSNICINFKVDYLEECLAHFQKFS